MNRIQWSIHSCDVRYVKREVNTKHISWYGSNVAIRILMQHKPKFNKINEGIERREKVKKKECKMM